MNDNLGKKAEKSTHSQPDIPNEFGEVWADAVGFEGLYKVSNFGRVWSVRRQVPSRWGTLMWVGGSIMKSTLHHNTGYYEVGIVSRERGLRRSIRIHKMVADAFISNPNNKPEVNHIDGNKANNCIDNLEWVTHKENSTHAINTGLKGDCMRIKCVETGEVYASRRQAIAALNLGHSAISNYFKFGRPSKGYTFEVITNDK